MEMNIRKAITMCVILGVLYLPGTSILGQAKRYIDRERGVSLTIPANWISQKFSIGALALRIEGYDNGHYANCSLTIVPTTPSSNSQDWLDKNINSVPLTDSQQKYIIDMLEAGSGGKINVITHDIVDSRAILRANYDNPVRFTTRANLPR